MSRSGIVAVVDMDQSALAIRTADGEYTIVEIASDWAPQVGDRIVWNNDDGLGFEIYRNASRNDEGEVFVQNHYVNEQMMRVQFPG